MRMTITQQYTHRISSYWRKIPIDLFKTILEKSKDINAKDKYGTGNETAHSNAKTRVAI